MLGVSSAASNFGRISRSSCTSRSRAARAWAEPALLVETMRHGEKIYETLATREELRKVEDMGQYYRVGMDDRDLNYSKYFTEGDLQEPEVDDYTSHNTSRMTIKEVEQLLLSLPEVTCEFTN